MIKINNLEPAVDPALDVAVLFVWPSLEYSASWCLEKLLQNLSNRVAHEVPVACNNEKKIYLVAPGSPCGIGLSPRRGSVEKLLAQCWSRVQG